STALLCLQRKEKIPYDDYLLFNEDELFNTSRDQLGVTRPLSKGLTFSEAVQGLCQQSADKKVKWKRIGISVDNFCAALSVGHPIVLGIQVNPELRTWQHDRSMVTRSEYTV